MDDRETASALGIDVGAAFFIVFCIGCALAGLAGAVAAPVLSIHPGMDMSVLVLALIVVVVGGPGSLKGAAAGALAVGAVETFGQVPFPAFAGVALYAAMAAALLLRPAGLVPARWRRSRRPARPPGRRPARSGTNSWRRSPSSRCSS